MENHSAYESWLAKVLPQLAMPWKAQENSTPPWDHRILNSVLYQSPQSELKLSASLAAKLVLRPSEFLKVPVPKLKDWKKEFAIDSYEEVDAGNSVLDYLKGKHFAEQTKCGPSLELAYAYFAQMKKSNPCPVSVLTLSSYSLVNVAKILAWKRIVDKKIYVAPNKRFFTHYANHVNILRLNACYTSALLADVDYIEMTDSFLCQSQEANIDSMTAALQASISQFYVLKEETSINAQFVAGNYFIQEQSNRIYTAAMAIIGSVSSVDELGEMIEEDWAYRTNKILRREIILTGVNDFIESKDDVIFSPKDFSFATFSDSFEKLRSAALAAKLSAIPWEAHYLGPLAENSAEINFVEHFFGAAGIKLHFAELSDVSKLNRDNSPFCVVVGLKEGGADFILSQKLRKISPFNFWMDFVKNSAHPLSNNWRKCFQDYGL